MRLGLKMIMKMKNGMRISINDGAKERKRKKEKETVCGLLFSYVFVFASSTAFKSLLLSSCTFFSVNPKNVIS